MKGLVFLTGLRRNRYNLMTKGVGILLWRKKYLSNISDFFLWIVFNNDILNLFSYIVFYLPSQIILLMSLNYHIIYTLV